MAKLNTLLLTCGLFLTILGTAWAYEEVTVVDGGTITGKVLLEGDRPDPKAYNLVLFPEPAYCGRISTGTGWRLVDQFQVAADGGLQHAVVLLERVDQGKPFALEPPRIEAKDCVFSPEIVVVRDGSQVGLVNMDPIMHDAQVYELSPSGSRVLFHRPLRLNPYHPTTDVDDHEHRPGAHLVDTMEFSNGRRVFLIECGFHEYMQTWGVRVDNPYYAITDEQGNFSLTDVPQGVYTLVAWHAGMGGILSTEVAILRDEVVNTRFEFEAPPPKRSAHTTMVDQPHYDAGVLGIFGESVDIEPTHKVQSP